MKAISKKIVLTLFLLIGFTAVGSANQLGHYRLNETSGTTVFDYSPSNFNVSTEDNPTQGVNGIQRSTGNWGDGLAYNFTGNSTVNLTYDKRWGVIDNGEKSTISIWVKPGAEEFEIPLHDKGAWSFTLTNNNAGDGNLTPRFDYYGDNTGTTFGENVKVGSWNHIVFVTYAGTNTTAYLNGTKLGTYSGGSSTTSAPGSLPTAIGGQASNNYTSINYPFNGSIDEVQIWNGTTTNSSEVDNLFMYNSLDNLSSSSGGTTVPDKPTANFSSASDYSWENPKYNEYWNRIELDPDNKFGGDGTYKWFYLLENQSVSVDDNLTYVYHDQNTSASGGGVRTRSYGLNMTGSFNTSVYVSLNNKKSAGLLIWQNGTNLTNSKAEGLIIDSSASCGSNRFETVKQVNGGDIDSASVDCSSSSWNNSEWVGLKLEANSTHLTVKGYDGKIKSSNLLYTNTISQEVNRSSIALWHQTSDSGTGKIFYDAWNFSSSNNYRYEKGWSVNPEIMIKQNYTKSGNKWTASSRFWNVMINPRYNKSSGEYYGWSRGKNYSDVSGYPRYYQAQGSLYNWDTGVLAYNKQGVETTNVIQTGGNYKMFWSFKCGTGRDICLATSNQKTGFGSNQVVIDDSNYSNVPNLKNFDGFYNSSSGNYNALIGTTEDAGIFFFKGSSATSWNIQNSGNAVLNATKSWEAFVSRPRACWSKSRHKYLMTYVADMYASSSSTDWYVDSFATSSDKVNWNKHGRFLSKPDYHDNYQEDGSFMDLGVRFGNFIETPKGYCHNTDIMFLQAEHLTHDPDSGGTVDDRDAVGVMAKNLSGHYVGVNKSFGAGETYYKSFPQNVKQVETEILNLSSSSKAYAELLRSNLSSGVNGSLDIKVTAGTGSVVEFKGKLNYSANTVNVSNDNGWFETSSVDSSGSWNVTYGDDSGETWSTHTFSLESTNQTTDNTAPTIDIVSPLNQTYSSSSLDLNVTSTEAVNFTRNVEYRNGTTVLSNKTYTENDQDLNVTLSGLPDGKLTVNVWGNDSAGNVGKASKDFTVLTDTYVTINDSVQINQSTNNAYINVTKAFNVSNLTIYSNATNFGGINWSITGNTSNRIDVKLSWFNDDNFDNTYLANYSIGTGVGTVVTSSFLPRPVDSIYQVYKNGNFFKQVQADANKLLDFGYKETSDNFTDFSVRRTDNFRPEFNSTTYVLDDVNNQEQLEFVLWTRGQNDLSSTTGVGTRTEFTNTSLNYSVSLPVSGNYKVSDFPGLSRSLNIDLSKSKSNIVEASGYSHTLSSQKRFQELNITNNAGTVVNYTWNSSLGGDLTGQVQGNSMVTVNDSSTGDFLNDKKYPFQVENGEIVLGFNYTGWNQLEIKNTVANGFSGVSTTGVLSSIQKCSRTNNTEVNVVGGTTENFTLGRTCNPGTKGSPTQSIVNISDNSERVWYNSTDMKIYTNYTENNSIVIRADKSNLKNPDERDGGSLKAYVEGTSSTSTSELNVTDTGGYFRIKVGTGFQSSSLHTDDNSWSVTYTLSGKSTKIIGGGGGGRQPTTEDQTVYFGETQTSDGVESFSVPFNSTTVRNLTITNPTQEALTGRLIVGDSGICQYVSVRPTLNSEKWGGQGSYDVPSASVNQLGTIQSATVQTQIRFELPARSTLESQDISNFTCNFQTASSYGVPEPFMAKVEAPLSLAGFLDSLGLGQELCITVPYATLDGGSDPREICQPLVVWLALVALMLVMIYLGYQAWKGRI